MSTERWDSVLFRNKNTSPALIGAGSACARTSGGQGSVFSTFPLVCGWTLTYGWFRNISIARPTSASSLFLDPSERPQSGMMDEVIKLEGEHRMKAEESISGKLSAICNSQTIQFRDMCL